MKDRIIAVIAAVGGFVLCAAGLAVVPSLESAERRSTGEASEHVERARRLLHKYDANLALTATFRESLDITVDKSIVDSETGRELYETAYQRMSEDYSTSARGTGDAHRQIEDGLRQRDALVAQNAKLLSMALAGANQALAISPQHAEAARIKGAVAYYTGLEQSRQAQALRARTDSSRIELLRLGTRAVVLHDRQAALPVDADDERIVTAKSRLDEAEARLRASKERIDQLNEDIIAPLTERIAEARSRAEEARSTKEAMETAGIDFSDPNGAETFASAYLAADGKYRAGIRSVQSLERGDYRAASPPPSGDFLNAPYVENGSSRDLAVTYGLAHYHDERDILVRTVEIAEKAIERLRANLRHLEDVRTTRREEADEIRRELLVVREAGRSALAELRGSADAADTVEAAALEDFDVAIRSARAAAQRIDTWINDASTQAQLLSPKARDHSAYGRRGDAKRIVGDISALAADARLAKAWIHHGQFLASTANREVLEEVATALSLDADLEEWTDIASTAEEAASAEIEETLVILERVHGLLDRHWAVTAQAAGSAYLWAMFSDEDTARPIVADVIESYREAIQGRENEMYAARIAARLAELEGR